MSGLTSLKNLTLLISDKRDDERDAVADAFVRSGGNVLRVGRFWDPPAIEAAAVRVYGADSFCLILQQKLGIALCSPDDELLAKVPARFLQREMRFITLGAARMASFPLFVKPVVPKQFRGSVYASCDQLMRECSGLADDTRVIVAECVHFTSEVRAFVLDGRVLDAAIYEGQAEEGAAKAFLNDLVSSMTLPRALVVDVGYVDKRGWAVVEFNAAWGAGLNLNSAVEIEEGGASG
jgi:ATP-grasp domain, R2K clade family 2